MKHIDTLRGKNRRSFLRGSLATGAAVAGAAVLGEHKLLATSGTL